MPFGQAQALKVVDIEARIESTGGVESQVFEDFVMRIDACIVRQSLSPCYIWGADIAHLVLTSDRSSRIDTMRFLEQAKPFRVISRCLLPAIRFIIEYQTCFSL